MNKITIAENKVLKLQNVLSCNVDFTLNQMSPIDTEVSKMSTYIQIHGGKQVGPLIQFTRMELDENNEVDINLRFMLQSDNYINGVEAPYKMESVIRVERCLYARYMGPEDKLKFAYDKLGVYAFENEIELDGCNYTIYVDRNEDEETMIADIFMPIKE